MKGKIISSYIIKNGMRVTTVEHEDGSGVDFEKLGCEDIDVSIKKWRDKRSKSANDYMWVLCAKIARKLFSEDKKTTKDDVYRAAIKAVGVFKDVSGLCPSDAETFKTAWRNLGVGWICEQVDYCPDGEKLVIRFYYGSSTYDTKRMARLLDYIIEDCKEMGIETMTPNEICGLMSLWETQRKDMK